MEILEKKVPTSITFSNVSPSFVLFFRQYFGSSGKTEFLQAAVYDRLKELGHTGIDKEGNLIK
jgi:hypothetical protein